MNRLCGLDLLRAIAIIWVMLFHATKYGTPSREFSALGWMGVDLFFVLSGFLIGSQLFKLVALKQEINLSKFYLNRVFRILPAYIVVLTIYFLVPFTREGNGLQPLWQFLSFSVNLFIDTSSSNTFSHVWSLCIEEYFYLFFPIVVLLLMHRSSFAKILVLSLFIVAFGMYLRGYIWVNELGWGQSYIEKIYYPTYTRLDGLLAGVLIAALKVFKPKLWDFVMNHSNKVLLVGLSGLTLAVWLFKARFGYMATVIGFPILSCSFAFIVAGASSPYSVLGKYKVPGSYFVATLAYSLYLTHKSVFYMVNTTVGEQLSENGYVAFFVYGVAVFLVAFILYVIVERPLLKLRTAVIAWDNRKPQKVAEINS